MKEHNNKISNLFKILYIIIFVVTLIVLFFRIYVRNVTYFASNEIVFTDDTKVKINDNEEEFVNLKDFSFKPLSTGDTFTIKKVLPNTKIDNPVVTFLVYHAVIDCYLDGNLIYSYGHDLYNKNLPVGSDYYKIPIPEDFQNKELTIKLTVTEKNAFSSIHSVKLQSSENTYKGFINSKIFIILITVPMLLLGLSAFIISTSALVFKANKTKLIYISLFAVSVSLWILSSNQLFGLIFHNTSVISNIEYLSLYLAPVPLLLYFFKTQQNEHYKKVFLLMAHLLMIFNALVIILNYFNIDHLCNFLTHFQIIAGLSAIFIVYSTFKGYRQKQQHEKILTNGILIMLAIFFTDLIRFNMEKYLQITNVQIQISLVPFGAFVLVIAFLYSYGIETLNMLYKNLERQTLINLAYVDVLTKIPNRAKCEATINELEDKIDSEITIISLDLNNLKHVNDTYGHQYGDEMISKFSSILNEVFSNIGFIARMGGDEFIAILTDVSNNKVEKALYDLSEELLSFNKTSKNNYSLSVAYGYATRNKNDNVSLWHIYELADKAMYQNKKIQKQMLKVNI